MDKCEMDDTVSKMIADNPSFTWRNARNRELFWLRRSAQPEYDASYAETCLLRARCWALVAQRLRSAGGAQ